MIKTQGKFDIPLILGASFFCMGSSMMVTPLIAGFAEDLGAAAALMGIIVGIMNLVSLGCRPFVGNLADLLSKYRLASMGLVLIVLANIGYILAPNVAVIFLSRIINGIGFACCTVCMSTWLADMLPRNKIGAGMGLFGLMNALAMAISPAIGLEVYHLAGYRASFGVSCVFGIMTLVLIQCIYNKDVPNPGTMRKSSGIHIVDKHVIPVAATIMLFAIPYFATMAFIVTYAEGLAVPVTVSLFFPLYAGSLFCLRLGLKNFFDRFPFRIFLTASIGSVIVALLALTWLFNNWILFIAAVGMAGSYGIMYSVCQTEAIKRAAAGGRGLANSTFYVGFDVGMAMGPIIGGFLYGHVPLHLFFVVLLIVVPLALMVYWFDPYR